MHDQLDGQQTNQVKLYLKIIRNSCLDLLLEYALRFTTFNKTE